MTTYPFADRSNEHRRLIAQGSLFDPLTDRLFAQAGLAPGMQVLDLGSGAGNVTRLAADRVGRDGRVMGIDADPAAVELATAATEQPNVEYRVGDVSTLDGLDGEVDAVVGRLVLMYLPDPADALRRAARRIRPGGLICLHEGDLEYLPAGGPPTPLWTQVHHWFVEALQKAGVATRLGPDLFTTFRAAGLPAPHLVVEQYAEGGPGAPAWAWANVYSSALPLMERFGLATRAQLDPETLADRLLAETLSVHGCVLGPPMTGAWCRLPLA
ncbi:class I SAM-dependent methyltransferase [Nocardioides sp. KR10-350]|uniref:class I SAM-dependent methyltransferase n=1 Tax=Nocardioides cheoyonin TaxID=3156615 RepID=UPI0032B60695